MVLFFRIITRLIVMAIAYVAACIAATATLGASVIGWRQSFGGLDRGTPEEEIIAWFFTALFGIFSLSNITYVATTPALIAALVTEAFSLKSWLVYIGIGGVLALVLLTSAKVYDGGLPPQQDMIIALAAGFVGGTVYWLFAGRGAGSWRVHPRAAKQLSAPE
ncbi:MAG: hypothetical protein AAFW47_00595 [Pseudomonadota bacterium]